MSKSRFYIAVISFFVAISCTDNQQIDVLDEKAGCPAQYKEREQFMEAERVAFLTRELELTANEAKVFWPVFDSYAAQRNSLWRSQQQLFFKTRPGNIISKELALETLDSLLIVQEQMLKNDKEFKQKLIETLPAEKALKLFHAEHHFKRHLLKQIRKKGRG